MNLRDVIVAFVDFREEVITKRTIYELGKARERAHVLAGLAVAVAESQQHVCLNRDPQAVILDRRERASG